MNTMISILPFFLFKSICKSFSYRRLIRLSRFIDKINLLGKLVIQKISLQTKVASNGKEYKTNNYAKKMKKIKCVVIGDGNVGKTWLVTTYQNKEFVPEPIPRWADEKESFVTLIDETFCLNIFDTPGLEDYDRLRSIFYPEVGVFVICFSVVEFFSYKNVKEKWIPEIKKYQNTLKPHSRIPFILVGTQTDLRDDFKTMRRLRRDKKQPVTKAQGVKLAHEISAFKYYECSAINKEGLNEVFEGVINAFNTVPSVTRKKKKDCKVM